MAQSEGPRPALEGTNNKRLVKGFCLSGMFQPHNERPLGCPDCRKEWNKNGKEEEKKPLEALSHKIHDPVLTRKKKSRRKGETGSGREGC